MATKPTKLPQWSTNGGVDSLTGQANNLEPPTAKKQAGFKGREKPARNWLNWLLNNIYTWCQYLDDLAAQAFTWTAVHIFSAAATFNSTVTIAGADVRHGNTTLSLSTPVAASPAGQWVATLGNSNYWTSTANNDVLSFVVPLQVGDRIRKVYVYMDDNGSVTTAYLRKLTTAGVATTVASKGTSGAAGFFTVQIDGGSNIDHTVAAQETLVVQISASAGSQRVAAVEVLYDRVA